jgi:hypothetical protein
MSVPIENCHDGTVAGPGSDLPGTGSCGNPESHGSVSEVVRTEVLEAGFHHCWLPYSVPPVRQPRRIPFGGSEHEILWGGRKRLQVIAQGIDSDPGEWHCPSAGFRLRRAEVERAGNLDQDLCHVDACPENIHPLGLESEQLANPQTAKGTEQNRSPIGRIDGIR